MSIADTARAMYETAIRMHQNAGQLQGYLCHYEPTHVHTVVYLAHQIKADIEQMQLYMIAILSKAQDQISGGR